VDRAPSEIAGETVVKVDSYDGVKYHLADDSWLLRVYAEASSEAAVNALLQKGCDLGDPESSISHPS
jgi:phosphomannomutase